MLTPRTKTWIDEMKEVSNVFQFHFNCGLKLKETIRPHSVLLSKESTERGVNVVTLDEEWTWSWSWLHITNAVWQKLQGWCNSSTLENPEYIPILQQLKSGLSKDDCLRCFRRVVKLPEYSLSMRSLLL